MRPVGVADIERSSDAISRDYVSRFSKVSETLLHTMEGFGVEVETEAAAREEEARVALLRRELVARGAQVRNGGKSIVWGRLSPACARCRTGVKSFSTFLSLACDRNCWFCFNPNQWDFSQYHTQMKDWREELQKFKESLGGLDFIALTGGEPLLYPDEAIAFFRYARALSPEGHLRLYTSGGRVEPCFMACLAQAGVDEIRFSVKLEDSPSELDSVFSLIQAAAAVIPTVLVEMPVVPGTKVQMIELLQRFEEAGVAGVNLLELCFPLHNAQAFQDRALQLKRHPYTVPYSYDYAGALPVAGSESLALELMAWAIDCGLGLSLHWCSLENKNTAQVYRQNGGGAVDIPPYRFSSERFFYETVRAFGDDVPFCLERLVGSEYAFEATPDESMVAFDPAALEQFAPTDAVNCCLFLASAIIETDEQGSRRFREVGLERIEEEDLVEPMCWCNGCDDDGLQECFYSMAGGRP